MPRLLTDGGIERADGGPNGLPLLKICAGCAPPRNVHVGIVMVRPRMSLPSDVACQPWEHWQLIFFWPQARQLSSWSDMSNLATGQSVGKTNETSEESATAQAARAAEGQSGGIRSTSHTTRDL